MGIFEDLNKFFETRLEEFLRNNPHLELQAILEQLQQQEKDALKLISDLQQQEKSLEQEILSLAEDIKIWHARIDKAKTAGRLDLANAAQEREASLLRQGNQVWGQMEGAKKRIVQTKELLGQIKQKQIEVNAKADQVKAETKSENTSSWDNSGWNQGVNYTSNSTTVDSLEEKFHRWEMDEEIEQLKRKMNR